jgi:hypothetical protein
MNFGTCLTCALAIFLSFPQGTNSARPLPLRKAPTIYIVAKSEFDGDPSKIFLRGVTNLPPKSLLEIKIYDFIGQGSRVLNVDTTVQVSTDGFFESSVAASPGQKFRHNLVCDVIFIPQIPNQDASVVGLVGKRGESLGFPKNPQVEQNSGGYYLIERIHVP